MGEPKKGFPKSPRGRVSFQAVYHPNAMEGEPDTKKRYNVTLLIPKKLSPDQKELLKAMKAAAEKAAQDAFKCGLDGKYKGKPIRSPFHDGAEKEQYDGYGDGVYYICFKSKRRPRVVGPDLQEIEESSGDFYNGCWARVSWDCYAYTTGGNYGVNFGLRNVQKLEDDECFGAGASSPEDDFGDDSDAGDDEDDDDPLG